jgi:hypothetical protein
MCLLPFILVFAYEPFSFFEKEKEKENVLWHICSNAKSPPKIPIRSNFN